MRSLVLSVLVGCGRIGFGDAGDELAATVDAGDIANDALETASTDGSQRSCGQTYATVGGLPHTYKQVASVVSWSAAKVACEADGAYLWIANDAIEASSIASEWMGITDEAADGVWLTVEGAPAPYAMWKPAEPDGGASENCARDTPLGFETRPCAEQHDYACECE